MKDASDAMQNSPKNAQATQEYLIKQRQQQTAQPMSVLDSVATAGNADELVKNDPELAARYQELAPTMGLNPDPSTLIPENARAFGRMAYNHMAGASQLPTKSMPEIFDPIPGANGQLLLRSRTDGKISEPIPQKLPSYEKQESWNPTTGQRTVQMIMTNPGGTGAPMGAINAAARCVGSPARDVG
jgi:hypothetical protein